MRVPSCAEYGPFAFRCYVVRNKQGSSKCYARQSIRTRIDPVGDTESGCELGRWPFRVISLIRSTITIGCRGVGGRGEVLICGGNFICLACSFSAFFLLKIVVNY